jgi:hypothetical protein
MEMAASFEIGNTYHWPEDGESRPWTEFWVTTFTKPVGIVAEVEIHFSTDNGVSWSQEPMNKTCVSGEQDVWHAHIGTFPADTIILYAVKGTDQNGESRWDNHHGQNYRSVIGTDQDRSTP